MRRAAMDGRAVRYGRWVVRWRWPILLASFLVVAVAGAGGRFLGFTSDYRAFFSEENPQLAAFEALQDIYTKNDNILIVVAAEGEHGAFGPEALAAVETLTREAWQIPYALRVDAVTNWQHTTAEHDDLVVRDLVEGARELSPEALAAAREVALAEPLLARRLVSEDARVTAVNVTLQLPGASETEQTESVVAARALADRIEADYPGVTTHLTGMSMLSNAFTEESMNDMTKLVPLMYLAIVVAMIALLRSVTGTVATVIVIGASVTVAMGMAGWFGIALTPPSASAPTMIMTLAVADSVHVLVTLLQAMRAGLPKRDAVVETLRVNLQPVFLTSLTTAIGFLSMNFSDAPPFHDLGNLTALGVTAAFFFAVLTLPALMAVLPVRVRVAPPAAHGARPTAMARLGDWVVAHRTRLLYGSAAVIAGFALLLPLNELNDDFVGYFDERVEFRRDTDFTSAHLTGVYNLEFSLGSGEAEGISDPTYLATLADFAAWWDRQPDVRHVASFSQVMERLNQVLNGDDPAYDRVPDDRRLAAQYLLLYELSLPYGLDLNNQINVDKSSTRFTVTVDNVTTRRMREMAAQGEAWLREHAPPAMHATAASPSLMFAHISERNIKGMLGGTLLAFFLVSAILVVALRSIGFGVMSLVPNMAPAVLGFGVWGVLVGQINIALSAVVAMTIGIVVDDTVHFLSKYLRARREKGLGPEDAVRYAFASVGAALLFTTAILAVGFGVLSLSAFDLNAGMGKLTAVTIVLALAADFFFLPPLLLRMERGRVGAVGRTGPVLGTQALEGVGAD